MLTDNVNGTPVPTGCRFCGAVAEVRDDPAVARLLDALRDEATVALMHRTGMDLPEHRVRGKDRKRMIRALSFGSLLLREMVDEVYPIPSPDPEETALRINRVKGIAYRLVLDGVLIRVARGRFALAVGPHEDVRATIDDCRRILADPHVNPPGLTVREIADRLDIPLPTVQKWLGRLRDDGAPLAVVEEVNPVGGRRYRYRIDSARKERAA